ncbi:MAG: Fe-S cluster assembly protein HesB [Chlorobium sp.]|uniref:DNA-3-methyladenine glycosylase family protein n=1 Tax=Chlorobium sp. TaxID=1095 RepID=UPI002F3FAD2A
MHNKKDGDRYIATIITDKPVSVHDTLFSGQTFRWVMYRGRDPYYISVIHGSPVIIKPMNTLCVSVYSDTYELGGLELGKWAEYYLSLDINEQVVMEPVFRFLHRDIALSIQDFYGLKVLRQDPFETAVTFMCAQGIGMPIIRRQIGEICRVFGDPVSFTFEGIRHTNYAFPSPERIASAHSEDLRICTNNNCRRAVNIRKMAGAVASGELDFRKLASPDRSLDSIRDELCRYDGIGPKIADCIALFGLGRFDAFPIDTHVRQYLHDWFGLKRAAMPLTVKNYMELQREIRSVINPELAGYAGHLLFHCWRRRVKGLNTA